MVDHFVTFWVFILMAALYWRVRAGDGERRLTVGIAAVAMIAGVWVLEGALLPEWRERAARDWAVTEGTVVYSRVAATSRNRNFRSLPNRYANVGTEFTAGGVLDTAWRVGLTRGVGSSAAADSVVARYPEGARVRVYYDPARPWEAVLEREAGALPVGRALFGGAMVAGALGLLLGGYTGERRGRVVAAPR